MKIKINVHGNSNLLPEKHGEWIDLKSAEEVRLSKGELYVVSLGVSMALPEGYYAHIAPRSSTCKNFGVICANSIGIIENSYAGNDDIWGFPVYAIWDTVIPKYARLCQFRLEKLPPEVEFEEVEDLEHTNRGGFGSTGW